MAIQNDKLLNLAGGKVLYDDLRERIENGSLKSTTDNMDDVLTDKYVSYAPEQPSQMLEIEADKGGIVRRVRIDVKANQNVVNNGLEYVLPNGVYGNLMNPALKISGKYLDSTGEVRSRNEWSLYGPLVLNAGTYTVSGYNGTYNGSTYWTYTNIFRGEQTIDTISSSNLVNYFSVSGSTLTTFTLTEKCTVFISRRNGSGYLYHAKVFSGELTDQSINKLPYGNQADITPWNGNNIIIQSINEAEYEEISTTEIVIPNSPAIYAGEILVGVSRARIISKNAMLDLANATGLVMDSSGVFHFDLDYEVPPYSGIFSNLYRTVDYADFADADYCIALTSETSNDESFTRIHIKDSRKTTLADMKAYTDLQICYPMKNFTEIAVDTTPVIVTKGINLIQTIDDAFGNCYIIAIDYPIELENAIKTGRLVSKYLHPVVTGDGTLGEAGSSTAAYTPSLWTFDLGLTPTEGDTLLVKVPVAGVNAGIWMSVDNGTTYYPVAVTNTAALTTTYPVGAIVMLTYEVNRNTTIYGTSIDGADPGATAAAYTSDRWVVTNYYANTTYSTISESEMNTGTATTGRLISAARLVLKANKANPVFTGSISLDRIGTAGTGSIAVGSSVTASGDYSQAVGGSAYAYGRYSHAEGNGTFATGQATHVFGRNNEDLNAGTSPTAYGTYVEMVGNGSAYNTRSNARTLDWSGNETLAGSLTLGGGITIGGITLTAADIANLKASALVGALNGTTWQFKDTVTLTATGTQIKIEFTDDRDFFTNPGVGTTWSQRLINITEAYIKYGNSYVYYPETGWGSEGPKTITFIQELVQADLETGSYFSSDILTFIKWLLANATQVLS